MRNIVLSIISFSLFFSLFLNYLSWLLLKIFCFVFSFFLCFWTICLGYFSRFFISKSINCCLCVTVHILLRQKLFVVLDPRIATFHTYTIGLCRITFITVSNANPPLLNTDAVREKSLGWNYDPRLRNLKTSLSLWFLILDQVVW